MQIVTPCKEPPVPTYLHKKNEPIQHFSLQGMLAADGRLALNPDRGILSLLSFKNREPRIVMQQQFTGTEIAILLPLLDSYPYYCSYETLFAHFYHGNPTDEVIARYRQHLHDAFEDGSWEQEMRPIRNVLSRARLKLRDFGLHIMSITEMGYVLMVAPGGTQV